MKNEVNELRKAILAKDGQMANSILRSGLDATQNQFVDLLREKGVLRLGRYGFSPELIAPIAEAALKHGGASLSTSSEVYLKSVVALSDLAPAVAGRLKSIQMFVNSGQFKTFLVTIEILFRRMHAKVNQERLSSWRNYGLEELAEGFSYYFPLLREKETIKILDINKLLTDRLDSDFYLDKLAVLASIARFREAEVQIEGFPYMASTSNLETTVQAISPEFEKSVHWGYIVSEEQRNADRVRWSSEGAPSLKELATVFVENLGDKLFEIVEGEHARIRVHFPLMEQFVVAFTGDSFFLEDVAFIRDAMKSLFVTYEKMRTTAIYNTITLIDVLKFRRLCVFLQAALDEFCKRKGLLNSPKYYASLVGHFNNTQAVDWISKLTGIADPKSLLDLLCSSEEKSTVFDLQYTPIIKAAGQYLVPIGVVANCNVMRNALQRSRFRFDSGSKMDPIGDRLVATFHEVKAKAKAKNVIRFAGTEVEADVLAVVENHLFVFECKNSLHPCNTYELRQSYDYIIKAAAQLSRFREMFTEEIFRRRVSSAAGFDVTQCVGFTTCILIGNRMFNGHREDGHAVRNIYELENVISGGGLTLVPFPKDPNDPNSPKIGVRVKSWSGENISASDLIEYIERDSWHRPAFNAMDSYDEVVVFGQRTLRTKSFMLDVGQYRDLMRQHPQAVEQENIK